MKLFGFSLNRQEWLTVLVVSLAYWVDLYDLLLYSSVRKSSLTDMGVTSDLLAPIGLTILNWQLFGLLVGGLFWGVLADKKGRLSMLYLSILIYSVASIANAFVQNIDQYIICRFISGIGLAGEFGVGIALISENLPANKRTISTAIVGMFGFLGGACAGIGGTLTDWKTAYIIGGIMGLAMLLFRLLASSAIQESAFFEKYQKQRKQQGSILYLFTNPQLLYKYILSILSGAPIYIYTSLFVTLAPEFAKLTGVTEEVTAGKALLYYLLAAAFADVLGGFISKALRSRKKALLIFCLIQIMAVLTYVYFPTTQANIFYWKCFLIGVGIGSWSVLVVNSGEQFGVNLRATVTSSISNFVRGLGIPATILFQMFASSLSKINAVLVVSLVFIAISMVAILLMKDNFENNLDYND